MDFIKKDLALIKTILSSVMSITGILTIVFSILCLADVKGVTPDTALRYIAGISLIACGTVIVVLNLCKETHKVDVRDVLAGSVLIGFGVFFIMEEAFKAIRLIIGLILPLIISCMGGAVLLKGGVLLLTMKSLSEEEKKNIKIKGIFLTFFGTIILVVGILLCIFRNNDKVYNVIWLIAGLVISCISFIVLISSVKDLKKLKNGGKDESKEEDDTTTSDEEAEVKEIETQDADDVVEEVKDI